MRFPGQGNRATVSEGGLPHLTIARDALCGVGNGMEHVQVQGVEFVRSVERDKCNAIRAFLNQDAVARGLGRIGRGRVPSAVVRKAKAQGWPVSRYLPVRNSA